MKPEIPNHFYRVSVRALILDETRTRFLITQKENGRWVLPGGGLDWGEHPFEGLKREIMGEMSLTTISIKPNPSYFLTFLKNKPDGRYIANVLYETMLSSFDFTPSEECVACRFVTKEEACEMEEDQEICILGHMFDPKNHVGT